MNEQFSVTYSLERKDFKAFTNRVMTLAKGRKSGKTKTVGLALWLACIAFFLVVFQLGDDFFSPKTLLAGALFAMVFLGVFIVILLQNGARMMPEEAGFVLGERTLSVSEAGLEVSGQHYNNRWDWEGLTLIDETKHYLFLFVDINAAHIIPRRIFTSNEAYEKFRDRIRTLQKHTKIGNSSSL